MQSKKHSHIEIITNQISGVINGNTIKDFVQALRDIGYHCHYAVVNTKDYGVPQNRERLFLVGFLDHNLYHRFDYAPKIKLEKRLKDVLEDNVDEKYYLKDAKFGMDIEDIGRTIRVGGGSSDTDKHCFDLIREPHIDVLGLLDCKGTDQIRRVYGTDGIATTLTTIQGGNQEPKIQVPSATKQGYETATTGDSINLSVPNSKTRRGRVGKQVAQTLDTACNQAVVEPMICASRGRNPDNPSDRTAGNHVEQRIEVNKNGTSNALTCVQKNNYVLEPVHRISKWYEEENKNMEYGDVIQTGQTNMRGQRIYKDGIAPTLPAENPRVCSVLGNYRIRKLTPREAFRLQDFPDDFKFVVSNSQLYRQAGNSMSVNILEMIFFQINKAKRGESNGLF